MRCRHGEPAGWHRPLADPLGGQLLLGHPRLRVRQEPREHPLLQGRPSQAPGRAGGREGVCHPGSDLTPDELQAGAGGAEDKATLGTELPSLPEGHLVREGCNAF